MNEKIKRLTIFCVFISILLILTACGSSSEQVNQENDNSNNGENQEEELLEVSVAVVNDYPPFEYIEDGELAGFDIELLERIGELENMKINWEIMKFDGIIPALQGNQVDAAASAITITDERSEVVNFSDPYFDSGSVLIVAKDSPIQVVEDIDGKKVVAKQGTTGLMKAREFEEEYDIEISVLQDDVAVYLDVETGNSDVAINEFISAAYKINQEGEDSKLRITDEILTGEQLGFAVSKDNSEVLERINSGISKLQENGEYDDMYSKYFSAE